MIPIRPGRRIHGISAVLLPFTREVSSGDGLAESIAWAEFEGLLQRTAAAGIDCAVNMDTGFGPQLSEELRLRVLDLTRGVLGSGGFVAGAFVADRPGADFDCAAYRRAADAIVERGGTPIFFPSYGLVSGSDDRIVERFQSLAEHYDTFLAFELGEMFAPFGRVFSLEVYERLLEIPQCVGAKHSSLDRRQEWERLELRDRKRTDFHVYTGNDLAIDMVMWGSDYLLGLSAFHPEAFAARDRWWAEDDARFFALNDALQYLGAFAFRPPVPAYKHSAAMLLKQRGRIHCSATHPASPTRPQSDELVLAEILERIDSAMNASP